MNEFRIKGLSCGNCAQMLEYQIKQLEYGESAKLSYNSGKLTLNSKVQLSKVEQILKSDGAYIEKEHDKDDHNHEDQDHVHSNTKRMLSYLIFSTILFIVAILLDGQIANTTVISMYLIATVISGHTTFIRGIKNLLSLKFNIDTLMTIALVGAVSIGEWKEATLVAILFGLKNFWKEWAWRKPVVRWKHFCR